MTHASSAPAVRGLRRHGHHRHDPLQQVRYRPTETGPWRAWSFSAIPATRQQRGATAADVQAFQARLQELGAIVKRAAAVSTPIGFAGELWGSPATCQPPTSNAQLCHGEPSTI
jgi:hypothetical protein